MAPPPAPQHLVDVLLALDFENTMTITESMIERLAPNATQDDLVRAAMAASCLIRKVGRAYQFEKVRIQRH